MVSSECRSKYVLILKTDYLLLTSYTQVVDENYVIKVPEKMNVAAAAPLLCAGVTCFAPFLK